MSEQGIVCTGPVYHEATRAWLKEEFAVAHKGSAEVCLSLIGAFGGLAPGEEIESAREIAEKLREFIRSLPSDEQSAVRLVAIPDDGEVVEFIVTGTTIERVGYDPPQLAIALPDRRTWPERRADKTGLRKYGAPNDA